MKVTPESDSNISFQLDEFYTHLSEDGRSIDFLSKEQIEEQPFPGLRPYKASEFKLFKGRDRQSQELIDRLKTNRFLAVIGSSGTGKSSLVRAGLIPQLFGGYLYNAGTNWDVTICRPGKNPMENLAYALARTKSRSKEDAEIRKEYDLINPLLNRTTYGILDVNELINPPELPAEEKSNLLIVIDQFEELFRFNRVDLGKPDLENHFVNLLLSASSVTDASIYIMITMRSEFLGDCVKFRGLPESINQGQYLVPQLTRDQIKNVIVDPILLAGKKISPGLVELLVNEIEASKAKKDLDQLPILQHALMRTFQKAKNAQEITYEHYTEAGEMENALANHAENKFAELSDEKSKILSGDDEKLFSFKQKIAKLVFQALTDASTDKKAGRRPTELKNIYSIATSSLGATNQQVDEVVDHFRDTETSFIMPPINIRLEPNVIMDISHESLMRGWKGLVKWAGEEAKNGEVYLRLVNADERAKQIKKDTDEDSYLVNPELEITLDWKEKNNPTAKWAEGYKGNFEQAMNFLEVSRKNDQEEKRNLAVKEATRKNLVKVIIALLGVLFIAAAIMAFWFNALAGNAIAAKNTADSLKNAAFKALEMATFAEYAAKAAQKSDSLSKVQAEIERNNAIAAQKSDSLSKVQADKEKDIAIAAQKRDSVSTLRANYNAIIAKNLNLKNAASEYARLIQDGPSDDNNNFKEFYNENYFLAYNYHFGQLDSLLKKLNDKPAYKIYHSIKNKLYYDNELYKRIYEDFEEPPGSMDAVIKKVDNNINNSPNNANAKSKNGELNFSATDDNYIYVYNDKQVRINTIYMGTKITALDFNDSIDIIYFGTSSGYIGYVEYTGGRKKFQPVFENKLESEITSIRFFDYKDNPDRTNHFLLVTAETSSARLYKLDDKSLKPNKLLIGNSLPYKKEYGNIKKGVFKKDKIILYTSKGTYSWDPFTYSLLPKLNLLKKFNPSISKFDETKFYY